MRPFIYTIIGILAQLENARTWDYQVQARAYCMGYAAAGMNYSADVYGGITGRARIAELVAQDLRRGRAAELAPQILICHSNGCAIALEALKFNPDLKAELVIWLAPAIDDNCDASGLNMIAERGQIGELVLGVSPDDEILGLPAISYGALGRKGPQRVGPQLAPILDLVKRNCGHSDWVSRDYEATMEWITPLLPSPPPGAPVAPATLPGPSARDAGI